MAAAQPRHSLSQRPTTMKLDDPAFDSMSANERVARSDCNHARRETVLERAARARGGGPDENRPSRRPRPHPDPDEGGTEVPATSGFAAAEHGRRHRHWPMDERDLRAPDRQLLEPDDYAALVAVTARILARQAPIERPSVFNVYSQAHMTGPLYHAALNRLGGVVFDRSHHAEETFPASAQAELFDFDTLVSPAKALRGKGVGLQTLLDEDADFLSRHGVRWWIGSSGTFDPDTITSARRQGVEAISNLYGCSEFGLFAISCPSNPGDFHVAQGHVLVEVVDQDGVPVRDGQFGRIVVTHLRGMDGEGNPVRHKGTQILRLFAGDGATYLRGPCSCGQTTSRPRDIRRIGPTD